MLVFGGLVCAALSWLLKGHDHLLAAALSAAIVTNAFGVSRVFDERHVVVEEIRVARRAEQEVRSLDRARQGGRHASGAE